MVTPSAEGTHAEMHAHALAAGRLAAFSSAARRFGELGRELGREAVRDDGGVGSLLGCALLESGGSGGAADGGVCGRLAELPIGGRLERSGSSAAQTSGAAGAEAMAVGSGAWGSGRLA